VAVLPVALLTEATPAVPAGLASVLATAGLALGGTVLPFTLFAFAQSRVSAHVAGAFLNLEPLVGAIAGAVLFRDPVGPAQVAGGVAVLLGIGLGSLQFRRARPGRAAGRASAPVAGAAAVRAAAPRPSADAAADIPAYYAIGYRRPPHCAMIREGPCFSGPGSGGAGLRLRCGEKRPAAVSVA
jgi:hypothetical protein